MILEREKVKGRNVVVKRSEYGIWSLFYAPICCVSPWAGHLISLRFTVLSLKIR